METIESFKVNHLTLLSGIYVSRVDTIDNFTFTTFDLRFTRPNFEPVMDMPAIHAIEHLGATYFRNVLKDKTMYFGPMGCRTGFYLILAGNLKIDDIKKEVINCLKYIMDFSGKIPGASNIECGNYLEMNLQMAKYYANKFYKEINK